jgi:hypothetical protein
MSRPYRSSEATSHHKNCRSGAKRPLRWSHEASRLICVERQRSEAVDFMFILAGFADEWLPFHLASRLARRMILGRVARRGKAARVGA